jgi:hypothetical protein
LVVVGDKIGNHAIDRRSELSENAYCLLMLLGFSMSLVGVLFAALVFGFFPDSTVPHLNFFS